METYGVFRQDGVAISLETSLVEWKHFWHDGLSPQEQSLGNFLSGMETGGAGAGTGLRGPLETSLVEWKPPVP